MNKRSIRYDFYIGTKKKEHRMIIIYKYSDILELKGKIEVKLYKNVKKTFISLYKTFRENNRNISNFNLDDIGFLAIVEKDDDIDKLESDILSDNTEAIEKVYYSKDKFFLKSYVLYNNCFMPIYYIPGSIKLQPNYLSLYGV